jgi:hypothetical protein
MKKTLVTLLTLVFVLSMWGTALAASTAQASTGPTSDVPKDHWAYPAVQALVKAGISDGYPDGTFGGDKTVTRYEMAQVVNKLIVNYDKATAQQKYLIDKLGQEFALELNRIDVRVAKVEAKQNVWMGGETRLRWLTNSPGSDTGNAKIHGSDSFDFRQRIKFWGTINDDVSWYGRLTTTGANKFGAYDGTSSSGSAIGIDIMAVTTKHFLGIDSLRVGRFPLDSFGHNFFGKPIGVDGFRLDQKFGDNVTFTGAVNNIQWNKNSITGVTTGTSVSVPIDGTGVGASGDAKTLSTGQLFFKLSDNFKVNAGYYYADIPGGRTTMNISSTYAATMFDHSKGLMVGFDTKLGDYKLFGDYVSTKLYNSTSASSIAVPTHPKAWVLELTNSKVCPFVFYPIVILVNPAKVGTDSWMISYREVDPGAIPSGAGGFDTVSYAYSTQLNSYSKATDNVKVLSLGYQNVIAKNVVLSLEYQSFKLKNKQLAGVSSDDLDKTTVVKFEFFY